MTEKRTKKGTKKGTKPGKSEDKSEDKSEGKCERERGDLRCLSFAVCLFAAGCLSSTEGTGADRPDCQAVPKTNVSYATEAQLEGLLVGRWQRCTSPQAPGEEVGVEFVVEGWWYPLIRGVDGAVVRRSEAQSGGPWQYLPPG